MHSMESNRNSIPVLCVCAPVSCVYPMWFHVRWFDDWVTIAFNGEHHESENCNKSQQYPIDNITIQWLMIYYEWLRKSKSKKRKSSHSWAPRRTKNSLSHDLSVFKKRYVTRKAAKKNSHSSDILNRFNDFGGAHFVSPRSLLIHGHLSFVAIWFDKIERRDSC